jgi:hypothetical protein
MTIVDVPRLLDTRGTEFRRVLRADVCSYGPHAGGTVDHISPRASLRQPQGVRNLTGSCRADNEAKGTTSLLIYLLTRLED